MPPQGAKIGTEVMKITERMQIKCLSKSNFLSSNQLHALTNFFLRGETIIYMVIIRRKRHSQKGSRDTDLDT